MAPAKRTPPNDAAAAANPAPNPMGEAESLFLSGAYAHVCQRFLDTAGGTPAADDVPWILGALVFLGRVDEARLLHSRESARLEGEESVRASFFLGVGEARQSRYVEARSHFLLNLHRMRARPRASRSASATFFAWQGASFFRQMECRYVTSLSSSRRAFDAAFLWGNPFARLLAADHRGHMLVRVGHVSEGLRLLAWAQDFAGSHGFQGFAGAIGVARLNYEAQHGREPHGDLARLEAHRSALAVEDCYSRASLDVELARQYLLRGNAIEARRRLDEAEPFLEARGQRRQKCSLWHRRAGLAFWEGRFDEALACLDRAEAVLDPERDVTFLLEVAGLRVRCLEETREKVTKDLRDRVASLTRRTGGRVSARILARHAGKVRGEGSEDDPLGTLLDRVEREFREGGLRRESQRLVADVLSSGYLLLLPRLLGFSPGACAIVLDPVPGGVLVVEGADVRFHESGSAPQVRALLLALSRAPLSKQEIVEWIWGYRYVPNRHDTLVYALVRRVRRLLGRSEGWLGVRDGRYRLAANVTVRVHEPGLTRAPATRGRYEEALNDTGAEVFTHRFAPETGHGANASATSPAPSVPLRPGLDLNHRQILLLEWLAERRFASAGEIMAAFAVSKATANRDLAPLLASGLVRGLGAARATRYELVRSVEEREAGDEKLRFREARMRVAERTE